MTHHTPRHGFTLIELIMVLGLVGILTTFSIAMSMSSVSRSSVMQERDLFVTLLLRGARANALANIDEKPHGVYIDNACHRYILFADTSFTTPGSCTEDPREIPYTNDAISVTNTGGSIIAFEQLSGDVIEGAGTITLSNGTESQEIIIRDVGQIDW